MLKIYFNKFLKELAFKLLINIFLKYINKKLILIFISYNNLYNK